METAVGRLATVMELAHVNHVADISTMNSILPSTLWANPGCKISLAFLPNATVWGAKMLFGSSPKTIDLTREAGPCQVDHVSSAASLRDRNEAEAIDLMVLLLQSLSFVC